MQALTVEEILAKYDHPDNWSRATPKARKSAAAMLAQEIRRTADEMARSLSVAGQDPIRAPREWMRWMRIMAAYQEARQDPLRALQILRTL